MWLLAITHHSAVRLAEVGFALMAIAGGLLALGAMSPRGRRGMEFLAGAALAAGGVLVIVATHWGHFG